MSVSGIIDTVLGKNEKMKDSIDDLLSMNPFFYKGLDINNNESKKETWRVNDIKRAYVHLKEREYRFSKITYYSLWIIASFFALCSLGTAVYFSGPLTVLSWMIVPVCIGCLVGVYKGLYSNEPSLFQKVKFKATLFSCFTKKGKAEFLIEEAAKRTVEIGAIVSVIFFQIAGFWVLATLPTYYIAKCLTFHYIIHMKGDNETFKKTDMI